MTYFVTGATGFIGRHLVELLLEREGDIYVLVREGSTEKLERLERGQCGAQATRIKPVIGDLAAAAARARRRGQGRSSRGTSTTSSTSPRSTT